MMEETDISALRPGGPVPEIEVWVVRRWKPAFRDNETCYIFVDKQGMGIQALAKGADQRSVASKLHVRRCYKVKGYACTDPDRYTSTLSHPAYMRIGAATVFTPIADTHELPYDYFEFATHERLEQIQQHMRDNPQRKNRVIVGTLQHMQDNYKKDGSPYVTMKLKDCRNKEISITLWEEIATSSDRFPRVSIETSVKPVIIAFTTMKVTDFMGKLQLQSTGATHLYLSPSAVETHLLLDLFQAQETQVEDPTSNTPICTETKLGLNNNVTISELMVKNRDELSGKIFALKAAIIDLPTFVDWHHIACPNCNQDLLKAGDRWFCSMHGNYDTTPHIYRLTATISDGTGNLPTTIYNEASQTLLGIPCSEMLAMPEPDTILQSIIDKQALFHIKVQKNDRTGSVNVLQTRWKTSCLTHQHQTLQHQYHQSKENSQNHRQKEPYFNSKVNNRTLALSLKSNTRCLLSLTAFPLCNKQRDREETQKRLKQRIHLLLKLP